MDFLSTYVHVYLFWQLYNICAKEKFNLLHKPSPEMLVANYGYGKPID